MRPTAYIVHHIPGRVRIRIPDAKNDPDLIEKIRSDTCRARGVENVQCNPTTGSLLIRYDAALLRNFEETLSKDPALTFELIADPADPPNDGRRARAHRHSHTAQGIVDLFTEVDDAIKAATDNQLDLKILLPVSIGVFGLLALRSSAATPLWLTLIIFSFHSFLTLHHLGPAGNAVQEAELVAGLVQ